MFYQTVLQWVGNGGAIDVQGKRLSFMGYMQVQAGDSVWTDGKVIFGNVSPKSTPNIAAPPRGVPVIGENLRGYVNRVGNYKKENIITDDWIINDDKNFEHGGKINGQKVIESEIFQNKETKKLNLYTVTDGFYKENNSVKYNNHLYSGQRYTVDGENHENDVFGTVAYAVCGYCTPYQGEEITLGVESPSKNQSAKIYRDGEIIEEINLKKYADFIKEKSWSVESKIMALSQNNGINYINQPSPPSQSFIASSYAQIVSLKVKQTGDWDAIIFASAYGYCFPYVTINGSVFEAIFNSSVGSVKTFSAELAKCLENLERTIFTKNNFPFLQIERYEKFVGNKKDNDGNYTPAYQSYVESAIEYYIPLVRFQFSVWYAVPFSASCLLRVRNGEIISVMRLSTSGSFGVIIEFQWNETAVAWYQLYNFNISREEKENSWTFPVDENYYYDGIGNRIFGVYDNSGSKVIDLTTLDLNIGEYLEITNAQYNTRGYNHIDRIATTYNRHIFGSYIREIVANYLVIDRTYGAIYFSTPVNALHESVCPNLQNKSDYFLMDGFFDSESEDGFFRFNPIVGKLTEKNYLFGVHDGELFFINENGNKKIGNKIKNFRLREMKNLNKAKAKNNQEE